MTKYLAAGASALAAIFVMIISFLSSRLKTVKREAADSAAKAKGYETQLEKIKSAQAALKAVDDRKTPESVSAPLGTTDRLERLNRLSDK